MFSSSGNAASEAIRAVLREAEVLKQQQFENELRKTAEERLGRSADAQSRLAEESLASSKAAREAQIAATEEATKAKQIAGVVSTRERGEVLTPEEASILPPGLKDAQMTLPGKTTTGVIGPAPIQDSTSRTAGMPLPIASMPSLATAPMMPIAQDKTGEQVFKGTLEDRRMDDFLQNAPESIRNYASAVRATGDKSLPYQLFQETQGKQLLRASNDRRSIEEFVNGKWVPATNIQKDSQVLLEPDPNSGESGRPYVIPVTTAAGIFGWDTRSGAVTSRIGDLKPGETAGRELTNAKTILDVVKSTIDRATPAWTGPLEGRYKTAEAALLGNDPEFANFAAAVAGVRNTFINLRTGAQMSEPEAARIEQELANVNQPLGTFVARAQYAKNYLENWLKNRSEIAYGTDDSRGPAVPTAPGGASPARRSPADLINSVLGQPRP